MRCAATAQDVCQHQVELQVSTGDVLTIDAPPRRWADVMIRLAA